jgi:hypothetical protein
VSVRGDTDSWSQDEDGEWAYSLSYRPHHQREIDARAEAARQREIDARAEAARQRVYHPRATVKVQDMSIACRRIVMMLRARMPKGAPIRLLREPVTGMHVTIGQTVLSIQWHSDAMGTAWEEWGLSYDLTFEIGAWPVGSEPAENWRKDLLDRQGRWETLENVTLEELSDILKKLEK